MRLGRTLPVLALAAALAGCAGPWIGGIHAVMRYRPEPRGLLVERVPAGGAAARAGLQVDDEVVSIEGVAVAELSATEVRERLRGEVGSRVRIRVRRAGAERDVVIERAPYRNGASP